MTGGVQYGACLPAQFQLGETAEVDGKRCIVIGVQFELIDFHDGLGIGPKVLYKVKFPNGSIRTVFSQDATMLSAPVLKIVRRCPQCDDTGMRDSGGHQPWGEPIDVPCECRRGDDHLQSFVRLDR